MRDNLGLRLRLEPNDTILYHSLQRSRYRCSVYLICCYSFGPDIEYAGKDELGSSPQEGLRM